MEKQLTNLVINNSGSNNDKSNKDNLFNLSELIFYNFIYEISSFLTKREKILLRELNRKLTNENIFSEIQINLFLKKKNELENFNEEKFDISKITEQYKNVEKFTIEHIKMNKNLLLSLERIIDNNYLRIRSLTLNYVKYDNSDLISLMFSILNKIKHLEEFCIGNIGKKDKLFLHLENNKNIKDNQILAFSGVNSLKIDNIFLQQIIFILTLFPNISNLTIENCSLDEDLELINLNLKENFKENQFISLDLSFNGLSNLRALEALKDILRRNKNSLKYLKLKGLWFQNLTALQEEFKMMKENLESLDFSSSKHIFAVQESLEIFLHFKNVKVLNLGDSRLDNQDLEIILKNLPEDNKIEHLNFFRSLLTNDAIKLMFIDYKAKLKDLEVLNLSFNQKITFKGLNLLLDNLKNSNKNTNDKNNKICFNKLKRIDLRNCGIILKNSFKNLENFILNFKELKPSNFEILELYFSSFTQQEYIKFMNDIYNKMKLTESECNDNNNKVNLKIFLKISTFNNKELLKKIEHISEYLFKNNHLIIR